ncbi:MAG TPA: glycoside hydrolase family 3 C-terminal domain-containing protein [Allosphingosinicella sp.]|nr:glycoside hydrolase family 3 C-terminal domain-containing protein [Allosphingosinicella sp.]
MEKSIATWMIAAAGALLATGAAGAPDKPKPLYMNPALPAEARAADLVHRMTLPEKASQLVNHARAIPRLGVPAYDWWSEALHGVAVDGTTEYPEPIGLAATFDAPGIRQMAEQIGVEGRIRHEADVRAGHSSTMEGLDFWAPNVNIFRDPRWGRGQETYGEDPFLTGRMAVAYVTGMQGDDPLHYRAISTPKHFAVHSGPEPTRHFADIDVSRHDIEDTYLPAFRAAITEGHAGSIMCAYNGVKGEPACANQFLLQHTLRGAWRFGGYVVSDCGAVHDIFEGHHYRPSQPQASAISLARGMDNECITFGDVTGDADYKPYIEAVHEGVLAESAIDTALIRLFTARIRLGMFDPPSMAPYSRIDPHELDSPAHRQWALHLAEESMVLLKNDGVLPLKGAKRIAIVGPLADQKAVLLGNYNGQPTRTVTILEGMKAAFPGATITYVPGTQFLSDAGAVVPASSLATADGKPGLRADYRAGEHEDSGAAPIVSRVEAGVGLDADNVPSALRGKPFNTSWTGTLTAPASGDYRLGIKAAGFAHVRVDGRMLVQTYGGTRLGRIHLEKGQPVSLEVAYRTRPGGAPAAQLIWAPVNDVPDPAAAAAARDADVVVAVVGISSTLEGEEMPVSEPGFQGGDRTSLDIPAPEEALVRAVAAAGKPLVVVLTSGSALAARWEKAHADAILEAWYPGEEGGSAVANILSGAANPSGRLPVTFYEDVSQLPNFEDYSMRGRTYRYFAGTPLWPFGYGLSYTSFTYGDLALPKAPIRAGAPLHASVRVTNSGQAAGDEVVQLYLKFPNVPGAPIRALRGFRRIHLAPGASETVTFDLTPRDLSMVNTAGDIIVPAGRYNVSIGGGQPGSGLPAATGAFSLTGQATLPE